VTLSHPVWLLLLVPLAAALAVWRLPSRLLLALRLAALLAAALALAGAALTLPGRAAVVVVVADRSRSMPHDADASHRETIQLLQAAMAPDERLAVVAFGQNAAVEQAPTGGRDARFAGFAQEVGRDASDLGAALETALALVPSDAPGRILVLSDGRWTGRDPMTAAASAAGRGVAVDFRLVQRPAAGDLAIDRFEGPPSAAPGESFLLSAWVRAPLRQEATVELRQGGRVLASEKRALEAGLTRLTFRDQAGRVGSQEYTLIVTGDGDDPTPENNRARLLVGVRGPKPLLHVAPARGSGLAKLLRKGGLDVEEATPEECRWSLESLARYSAVVLENVPADRLGLRGMDVLAAWVKETGTGLMMTGGRRSYGPGGYRRSPLEPILPVTMDLRPEHRKLALAMVVALDRSGSMAAAVRGGRTKMDLANQGAAAVLDLLGPQDEFGAIVIDTEPHAIARLAAVKDREAVRRDLLGVRSEGGGIYIDVALEAAGRMIRPARAGVKHIILFADAGDAEQPGAYVELVEGCVKDGVSVSVIGLGTEKDKDAELLRDIARRGNGRVLFTDDPEDLPRLFAQETFAAARSAFLEQPTPIESAPGLATLFGRPFELSSQVGGYNVCVLRPGATLAAATLDEYHAPAAAAWQAGAGRVVCCTNEADGEYAGDLARWPGVGGYYTGLARWAAGAGGPSAAGATATQEVRNGVARVELHLDPARTREPFSGRPAVRVLRDRPGARLHTGRTAMAWTGADVLTAEVVLEGGETAALTVEADGLPPLALPPVCLPYSPEYRPAEAGEGLAALEKLARATGGKERLDPAAIWKDIPQAPRRVALGPWLLLFAVAVFLLEVLERRTGLLARCWRRTTAAPPAPPAPAPSPAKPKAVPATAPTPERPAAAPAAAGKEGADVLDAMREARKRLRGRTDKPR
jgi:hypothetical protein